MVRTSKLSTQFANNGKLLNLTTFCQQYRSVVQDFIDLIWSNLNENYEVPKFICTKDYQNHDLSQRVIKCAATQASGIVRSCTTQIRKLIWAKNKIKEINLNTTEIDEQISKIKVSKPVINEKTKCELNSICCDIREESNFWFLQLKCLGEIVKFRIPLKIHRQTKKWMNRGKLLNSFLVSENNIEARFEIETPELKKEGKVVGLDQGVLTCITLSDGQVSKEDNHGWDLNKILDKISKKKKGSKNFTKACDHRKNYINWSINQLNLKDIKQINLEKVKDLRRGKTNSRKLSHWTYPLIKSKLIRFCEEQKVSVVEQSCTYRSQRCSSCGLVRKSSRRGKIFSCECGYTNDSDLNASLNHSIELPNVDGLRHLGYNIAGFYWLESGVCDLNGEEFTVPHTKQ